MSVPEQTVTSAATFTYSEDPPLGGGSYTTLAGLQINTTSPNGANRSFAIGSTSVYDHVFTTQSASNAGTVGSGFFCGIYGYLVDTNMTATGVQQCVGDALYPTNGIYQLGFAFLKPIVQSALTNMMLDSLALDQVATTPETIYPYSLANGGSTQESFSVTKGTSVSYTNSWSSTSTLSNTFSTQEVNENGGSNAAQIGVSATVSGGANILFAHASASVTASAQDTFTNTWKQSTTQINTAQYSISKTGTISQNLINTDSVTFSVVAPPHSIVDYQVLVWSGRFNVPWSATLQLTLQDGSVVSVNTTGLYNGVAVAGISVQIFEPQSGYTGPSAYPEAPPPSPSATAQAPSISGTTVIVPMQQRNALFISNFLGPAPAPSPTSSSPEMKSTLPELVSGCGVVDLNPSGQFNNISSYADAGTGVNMQDANNCTMPFFGAS